MKTSTLKLETKTQLDENERNMRANAKREVELKNGTTISLEKAYRLNKVVECYFPRETLIHIRNAYISPSGFVYSSKEDFDYFTED
ncbi:MAG TPA: hypothetical protein P5277_04605 [Candidatus Paceibacterota bacterium]|nr:hypothetical protein [Candidatus Paceibacterota bacterium]